MEITFDPVVYMATNSVNGKRYVGVSKRGMMYRRRAHHARASDGTYKTRFAQAIIKYGREAFSWVVLCRCATYQEALLKEVELIASLRPEYNVLPGGTGGPTGIAHNRKPVTCLNDGVTHPSCLSAAEHYGVSGPGIGASCSRIKILKGLHFVWGKQSLTYAERCAAIEERMRIRVQRRKKSITIAIGRQAARALDATGRRCIGPMLNARPVMCLDDGERFESASAAAASYGLPKSGIIELCLGKRGRKTIGGKHFAYIEADRGVR